MLARFMIGGLVAVIALAALGGYTQRHLGIDEAIFDAKRSAEIAAQGKARCCTRTSPASSANRSRVARRIGLPSAPSRRTRS
jgi:hypothetical protein